MYCTCITVATNYYFLTVSSTQFIGRFIYLSETLRIVRIRIDA